MLGSTPNVLAMVRSHVTEAPILSLTRNRVAKQNIGDKPGGLWYQVDGSWEQWCSCEMPHWAAKHKHKYVLEIDFTKVLVIDTPDKFLAFYDEYKHANATYTFMQRFEIDWTRVSKDYAGIDIPH